MKLKQSPGDFRVVEQLDFVRNDKGPYHIHRLVKEKLSTLEALDRVARKAGVQRSALAYAGLKDRQAITMQYVSIENGRVAIDDRDLKVRFVGRSAEQITSKLSSGNSFQVVVRDLTPFAIARLRRNKRAVATAGLPNYFDDQRFGSLAQGQGFVVRRLAHGRPDLALKQLVATPPSDERSGDAKLKQLLHDHWGDWETCRQIARGPMYAGIFGHLLRKPDDYWGAFECVPTRLKLIHLFSFQSYLWNLGIHRYLGEQVKPKERIKVRSVCGDLLCWRYLSEDTARAFAGLTLPLVDHKTEFADARFGRAMAEVMDLMRLEPRQLRIDQANGFRFQEEPRPLVLCPEGLSVHGPWPDDRNKDRLKVELRFTLPRGAYATLVVRRLFAQPVRERQDRPKKSAGRAPEARPKRRVSVLRRLHKSR